MMHVKVKSEDVAHSPEFKAFCQRFGIAWELPWRSMTITLGPELKSPMSITQEYLGQDLPQPDASASSQEAC